MASMQIVSGGSSAAAGKGAAPGGLDPLLMGLSPEAAAAAGLAGEGSEQENPFAAELAAALASLDAEQAAALAEGLIDGALQNGQIIDPTALALASGQNLPVDPAFQNAILASFAALNGVVQSELAADGVSAEQGVLAVQTAAADAALLGAELDPSMVNVAATGESPDVNLAGAPVAVDASGVAAKPSMNAAGATGAAVTTAGTAEATQASIQNNEAAFLAQSAAQDADALAQAAQAAVDQKAGAQTGAKGAAELKGQSTASGQTSAATVAADQVVSTVAQGQSQQSSQNNQSNSSSQEQAAAAALTEAARAKSEKDSTEYASKQTTMAGTPANDLGNVVLSAKPNVDAVGATADAARQSAQRIEGTTGVSAAQSSAQESDSAARAESKLEAARASLGSGPLNVEVLKLTRQGGGRAVLEVTPPNQGPIRIDLQLDGAGRANLVVEGLTESLKARLESSAHFLRQDMASMGLALNLEMRERNDSGASAQAFNQGQFGQSRQQDRDSSGQGQTSMTGQVSGNGSRAQRSTVVDDGIHLVA